MAILLEVCASAFSDRDCLGWLVGSPNFFVRQMGIDTHITYICAREEVLFFGEAFTTTFWMGAFKGPTAKRHRLWSNHAGLLRSIWEIGGAMSKEALQALPGGPLVKKYKDSQGRARCVGIPDKLRASQCLS